MYRRVSFVAPHYRQFSLQKETIYGGRDLCVCGDVGVAAVPCAVCVCVCGAALHNHWICVRCVLDI